MRPSPTSRSRFVLPAFLLVSCALAACGDDDGGGGSGLQLANTNGGAAGTDAGGGTSASKGGTGGSGGTGLVDPSSGSGGSGGTGGSSTPVGGSGGSGAGPAGSGGTGGDGGAYSFADAFALDTGESACSSCLKSKCKPENTACGDVAGSGACAEAVSCLANEFDGSDPNYNCAFETCGSADPSEAVNSMFICVGEQCASECYVTKGFPCK